MGIQVELCCPNCRKRYLASGDLAGKRVKCRSCGSAFDVPGDGPSDVVAPPAASSGATAAPNFNAQDVEPDFGACEPLLRPNTKHKFPIAAALDRWLPLALTSVAGLWVFYETLEDHRAGPAWVSLLRLPLILLLYVYVIVPLALKGLNRASRSLRFELPPEPKRRMAATCAIPVAFGYAMWLATGHSGALLIGLLVGLLLASPAFWFLFRPQGQEIAPSFAATCAGFLGGVVVAGLSLLVAGLFANAAMDALHMADRLQANPAGPGFAWNVTPEPASLAPGPAVEPAVVASVAPNSTNPHSNPASIFIDGTETVTDNGLAAAAQTHASLPFATVIPSDTFMAAIVGKHLPYVAAVHCADALGAFDNLITTATPSPWCATVRHEGAEERVEPWNALGWVPRPSVSFPSAENQGEYSLSPDGSLIARAVRFPKAEFQVWSLKESRMLCVIEPFEDYAETPHLIGFSGPRTVVIRGRRESDEVVEVCDAVDGKRVLSFWVYRHLHSPNNCKISPDGKKLAIVTRVNRQDQMLIYELDYLEKPRVLAAGSLDSQAECEPADIAFSSDCSTITALFERGGAALFLSWNLNDGHALPDRVCPGAWPHLTQTARDGGRILDFLGQHTWLLGGSALVDLDSGRLIANWNLSVDNQWFSDARTLQLGYRDNSNVRHVATLEIDQAVLNRR
ncbi:MAG TPA: hypothetical protein VG326_05930 [Tepidisphaeraceae bacterium]|jgi:hypothetical protein|nr:hypothetical protein [Tepidisphaeraceae bacterium]